MTRQDVSVRRRRNRNGGPWQTHLTTPLDNSCKRLVLHNTSKLLVYRKVTSLFAYKLLLLPTHTLLEIVENKYIKKKQINSEWAIGTIKETIISSQIEQLQCSIYLCIAVRRNEHESGTEQPYNLYWNQI